MNVPYVSYMWCYFLFRNNYILHVALIISLWYIKCFCVRCVVNQWTSDLSFDMRWACTGTRRFHNENVLVSYGSYVQEYIYIYIYITPSWGWQYYKITYSVSNTNHTWLSIICLPRNPKGLRDTKPRQRSRVSNFSRNMARTSRVIWSPMSSIKEVLPHETYA